jgi:hypothetical protein
MSQKAQQAEAILHGHDDHTLSHEAGRSELPVSEPIRSAVDGDDHRLGLGWRRVCPEDVERKAVLVALELKLSLTLDHNNHELRAHIAER